MVRGARTRRGLHKRLLGQLAGFEQVLNALCTSALFQVLTDLRQMTV